MHLYREKTEDKKAVTYEFKKAGTYKIALVVYDADFNTSTVEYTVTVK